jgi:general secretion pathway protein J
MKSMPSHRAFRRQVLKHMQKHERGFTLIELLLSLGLLAMMMVLIYASLNFGIRSWDTGDARITESAHMRIVDSFLRRELGQVFPVRWRGIPESRIAFEGDKQEIKFVTGLNIGAAPGDGGLQWAHIKLAADEKNGERFTSLFIQRERFDTFAKSFADLPEAKPVRLIEHVKEMEISYFGSENDNADPQWSSEWNNPLRLPQLIKLTIKLENGRDPPPIVVNLRVGEEAGCADTNYARQCGARRA